MKTLKVFIILTWSVVTQGQGIGGGGQTTPPDHVGGSIRVDVTTLVSNEDAQLLLDKLGPVTVQSAVQSYYPNATSQLIKDVKAGVDKGIFLSQVEGNALNLGLTEKGKALVVTSAVENGIQTWYLAAGLCAHPIVSYTELGTSSGKPGQTLRFTLNYDINTELGDIFGVEPEIRKEFTVDILPTSAGWRIDQTSANVSIKQASATAIGRSLEKKLTFLTGLPEKLPGKIWTRQAKKEENRDRYTFRPDGSCVFFDAKKGTAKNGTYSVKSNRIYMKFSDGDNLTVIVDYNNYGDDWLIMTTKGLVWSLSDYKFFATPE